MLKSDYELKAMQGSDVPKVQLIEAQSNPHPWTQQQFYDSLENSHHCWVVRTKHMDEPIAFAVFSTAADEAELLNIAVCTKHRRKGIAKALISAFLEESGARCTMLFLEVRRSNTHAINLYESLGFNEMGCRKGYYPANPTKIANESAAGSAKREDALIYGLSNQHLWA